MARLVAAGDRGEIIRAFSALDQPKDALEEGEKGSLLDHQKQPAEEGYWLTTTSDEAAYFKEFRQNNRCEGTNHARSKVAGKGG